MYNLYAKLLYTWTNDCDTNKETQKIALTMYEKAIKMDQSLGVRYNNIIYTRYHVFFNVMSFFFHKNMVF